MAVPSWSDHLQSPLAPATPEEGLHPFYFWWFVLTSDCAGVTYLHLESLELERCSLKMNTEAPKNSYGISGNTPSRCAAIHKHGISSNLKVILVTEATMELCRQDGGLHFQPRDGPIRHALGSPAGSRSERLFPGWSCGIRLTEMEVII